MAKAPRGSTRICEERPIGVQEASAVAYIDGNRFLVVDDEHGIFRCVPDEDPVPLEAGKGFADLEGICLDTDRRHAYVLAERDGSVWRFAHRDGELSSGERLGKLPRLNKKKNRGWEGIYFAPAGTFSDADELVGVHQDKPRRVGFFDAATLAERSCLRLPKPARKALGDLNDVAIHPKSHHLFVVSGKEGRLGELRITDGELELVRVYPLDTEKDDVPEGITFDSDGRMFIVTDGEGMLREMRLNA
jgi:uncharacterized protein YjiK